VSTESSQTGKNQKGKVNIPKMDGSAPERKKITTVMTTPIPQNSRTLLMADGGILLAGEGRSHLLTFATSPLRSLTPGQEFGV